MTEFGYALSSEEHAPNDLVRYAQRAEAVGFSFAAVSDHYHPWVDQQGHAPFVWSVIGGIAHATSTLKLGTGVTCPTFRIHPAIIAQAAATAATMMPGRFFLGVGSGENLNEHILGDHWPPAPVRQDMLAEAISLIRQLWEGGYQSFDGAYYTVENARIYTLPQELPPIIMAAAGPQAATLAGANADGLWTVSPEADLIDKFTESGGSGPKYGQVTVCWAPDEDSAKKTAYEWWPNAGIGGELSQELPLPRHFEQAAQLVTPDDLAEKLPLGPDPDRHAESVKAFVDAGYDHVYIHQIGPDQDGFFQFYERELRSRL
ncbi:MAG TPA: TIGR03557 family F420-dependent LLM class oxidoreductase [Acidimicrobiales bacterium]|nr:TIGR03557 family F420-dependent LLM class oxidoreductase [Acidimicrobiales bacterium]